MSRPEQAHWTARQYTALAVLWSVVHAVVWVVGARVVPGASFVPYAEIGTLGTPWIRQIAIPLVIVLALQCCAVAALGWWRPVMGDTQRSTRRATWIAPVLVVCVAAIAAARGFTEAPVSYYVGLVVACLLIGITEELSFRGVVLVALRGGLRDGTRNLAAPRVERRAVVVSSVLFGMFHAPNLWLGSAGVDVARQVVLTAVMGTAFVALRRGSGSVVPCMLLHAAYDAILLSSSH